MRRTSLALALLLVTAGAARADGLEDRLRSQLTATVSQMRELQASQATLLAQKTAAEKDRDALKAKLSTTEAQLRTARAAPRGPSADDLLQVKVAREQAARDQATQVAATAEIQRLSQEVAQLRADNERVVREASDNDQALKLCHVKHAELAAAAEDILAAYDHVSAAGVLVRREPLTGLGRLPAQRRVQAFADRLYAARLDVRPKPAAAATQPPAQ